MNIQHFTKITGACNKSSYMSTSNIKQNCQTLNYQ